MNIEIDFRDPVIYLNDSLINTWNSPNDAIVLTKSDKAKIISNIYDYLIHVRGFNNVKLEI